MTTRFIRGLVAHLCADWLLQNDWMARCKADLRSSAAGYVHAGIHTAVLLLVFKPLTAFTLGALHLLIDTRKPLQWWRRVYRQTTDGPAALHVAMWGDQVVHIVLLWLASELEGKRR